MIQIQNRSSNINLEGREENGMEKNKKNKKAKKRIKKIKYREKEKMKRILKEDNGMEKTITKSQ